MVDFGIDITNIEIIEDEDFGKIEGITI